MKIKKGDTVLIISGKDRGRTGKILKSSPREGRILIEGINLKSKHIKPKKQGEKGQIIKIPMSVNSSNVKIICPKCQKASRIGYMIQNKNKNRICKKCKSEI